MNKSEESFKPDIKNYLKLFMKEEVNLLTNGLLTKMNMSTIYYKKEETNKNEQSQALEMN